MSDFPFTFHFHALEKGMATRFSVLAWRIPGTGEPGGLPSMGSHRVRHEWSNLAAAAAVVLYLITFTRETKRKTVQTPFVPIHYLYQHSPFPGGSDGKASACDAGDWGLIPGSGRFPGEGNGNPLQYSCPENPMDGGGWWAIVTKSRTQLSNFTSLL